MKDIPRSKMASTIVLTEDVYEITMLPAVEGVVVPE